MNIFSFTTHFRSEQNYRNHFKEQCNKIGVTCKYGHTKHFWIKSIWVYQCKKYRKRTCLHSVLEDISTEKKTKQI